MEHESNSPCAESTVNAAHVLSALGMCAEGGALICGVRMVGEAMRKKKRPLLVLTAEDNAENSAKRLADKCAYYHVESVCLPVSGAELAGAVGKTARLAAVAVTDENLCRLVKKAMNMNTL